MNSWDRSRTLTPVLVQATDVSYTYTLNLRYVSAPFMSVFTRTIDQPYSILALGEPPDNPPCPEAKVMTLSAPYAHNCQLSAALSAELGVEQQLPGLYLFCLPVYIDESIEAWYIK